MSQNTKLLIIIALFWFAQYIYVPNTAPYLLAQKVTADFVGIIVGVYGGVQMSLRFPMGILADWLGKHKLIIIVGCAFSGGASVVRILESTGYGFLIANIMSGVASSLWVSFMLLSTKYITPDRMQTQIGYLFAANNFGIMLAFITSAVCFEGFGMDFLCLSSALSGALAMLLAMSLKEDDPAYAHLHEPPESKHRPLVADLVKVAKRKRIWFFAFLASIQQGVTMTTIMSFSNEAALRIGGSSYEMGLMTIVFILFNVISSYYSGKPPFTRISQGFLVSSALFLLAAYCFLSVMVTHIYLLIIIQVFLGWSFGFVFTIATSESIVGVEHYRRSSAIGLFQALFAIGMTTVPIIAGRIIELDDGDLKAAFFFQGWLCLIAFVATVYFYYMKRRNHLKEGTA
ncbi:MAG: MFS transporter [Anaerobiospirillum succiniciproducens]|uniref:MFS transporter n=1 Tax=Anaerobiospirillum succiniciproducens TaxID=13335 RepID=UPI002A75B59C|nr:MFS transporter [Anaerobiospirillum succiniciproducens]MDY2798363.1 MFS transporter [Anaerobiospirillum succiniciproducens]